jgi:hypothetical protein
VRCRGAVRETGTAARASREEIRRWIIRGAHGRSSCAMRPIRASGFTIGGLAQAARLFCRATARQHRRTRGL